jgi:AhpC/TSA family
MPIDKLPETAPDFTLDHILGHSVSLGDYRGQRVVIVFGGRESAPQIKQGISTIRRTYDPDELTIIGVSDLRAAPRPARILVKSQLKKAFEEAVRDQGADLAAAGKPPRQDPEKDVIMLMDWDGAVVDQYGVSGVDQEAAAVAVDGDGRIVGSGSGAQLGEQILASLGAS